MEKNEFITTALIGIALYLVTTGLSFSLFTYLAPGIVAKTANIPFPFGKDSSPKNGFELDTSAPKTEVCPLNGAYFTKGEREIWEKRRPLAVMVENHAEARPQSGISYADIIYEAVAEGGIPRFMAVYYCDIAAKSVILAPVRSARTYYLPWVLEYDALYNHVGGAGRCNDTTVDERAKALCQIDQWKVKDMDQFSISFPTCYRNYDRLDHPVATEHTMVCVSDKLYKLAEERGWTNVDTAGTPWDEDFEPWKFKEDAPQAERGASSSASFTAWEGYEREYGVRWDYDPLANVYKRVNGSNPHTDLETLIQLTAKVVIIQFAKEVGPVDGHAHLLYENIGKGTGLLLQDGKVLDIAWQKPTRTSRTKFYYENKEVELNRGKIWIELLPIGTEVKY